MGNLLNAHIVAVVFRGLAGAQALGNGSIGNRLLGAKALDLSGSRPVNQSRLWSVS